MKYCPNCGTQMSDDAVFCENCGTALNTQQTPVINNGNLNNAPQGAQYPVQQQSNQNIKTIIIIIVAVIIALAIALAGFFIGRGLKKDDYVPTSEDANVSTTEEFSGSPKAVDLDSKYLVDNSGLFTDEEKIDIIHKLEAVSDSYKFDVVIHTTDSYDGKSSEKYSDDFFMDNDYGQGSDRDGCIFVLNIQDGSWYLRTFGKGVKVISNDRIDVIADEMIPILKDGDYYNAMLCYIEKTSKYLYDDYYDE